MSPGIVLSWTMAKTEDHEAIASYQLYAYQEGAAPPSANLWKKVGSVKALELPMACTLTQVRQAQESTGEDRDSLVSLLLGMVVEEGGWELPLKLVQCCDESVLLLHCLSKVAIEV